MKRVAILYERLGRSKGGIEAWIYHASEELLQQKHEVHIYTLQAPITIDSAPSGTKIICLENPKYVPIIGLLIKAINLKKQLKKNQIHKYDKVWSRSLTMAWAASKLLKNKKSIYINAAPYSFYGRIPIIVKFKQNKSTIGILKIIVSEINLILGWIIERQAIRNSTNVFLSKTRRDETLEFFKLNIKEVLTSVIPAGVNLERFSPKNIKTNFEGIKIITVCRLTRDKNIQCLIKAVSILQHENYKISLTIVGEGEYEKDLINLVKLLGLENVIFFVGRQENVEEWYQNSNLFVLPSLYEGFGSVYIEAMACGLPCIAISNKNGKYSVAADEIIDDGVNGFLMNENEPFEIYEFIKRLYYNDDLFLQLSKNARKKVEISFSWKEVITKLLFI